MLKRLITQDRLKELLNYNPDTGVFIWNESRSRNAKKGDIAGCFITQGGKKYRLLTIDGKQYYSHRLAWMYVYGNLPAGEIDHIDGQGLNNKISNLRVVNRQENCKNQRLRSTNTSGVCGVYFHKPTLKWQVRVMINGKNSHIGLYENKEDAIKTRKNYEAKLSYHKNHGGNRPL